MITKYLKAVVASGVLLSSCKSSVPLSGNNIADNQLTAAMRDEIRSGYKNGFIKGLAPLPNSLNFLVVGDWGRNGQYHQSSVATQMGKAAMSGDAEFIISTGDNFYPSGVASVNDPQWQTSFEQVYKAHPLYEDWYVVLGNHDYKSNPTAQIAYSSVSRRWHMPARYFSVTKSIDGDSNNKVLLVFIDTNPFVKKYYLEEPHRKNVLQQDTLAQKAWLERTLATADTGIKWKLVIGHHPLYCGGKRARSQETYDIRHSFEPVFNKYGVDAYLCGHEHDLQHIKPSGGTHHFVSGAGSEVRPTGMLPESRFAASDFGFMHFSVATGSIAVNVVNDKGEIIYTTTIAK